MARVGRVHCHIAVIQNLKEQAVTLMAELCCLPFSARAYPVYLKMSALVFIQRQTVS